MQGLMFRCSTGCCADSQASMQQVHQCIKHCHASLAQAQALVTSKLEKFQDRLARWTMHCSDKAKDSIDVGSKELQVKRRLETCVTKCVDDHVNLIPAMSRIDEGISHPLGNSCLLVAISDKSKNRFKKRNGDLGLLRKVDE